MAVQKCNQAKKLNKKTKDKMINVGIMKMQFSLSAYKSDLQTLFNHSCFLRKKYEEENDNQLDSINRIYNRLRAVLNISELKCLEPEFCQLLKAYNTSKECNKAYCLIIQNNILCIFIDKEYEQALFEFEACCQQFQGNMSLITMKVLCFVFLKRYQQALKLVSEKLQEFPQNELLNKIQNLILQIVNTCSVG